MSFVQLKTELRQELKLTPQLLQSMEVLQMTSQELLEYITRQAEENPLLDQSDPPEQGYEALRRQAGWIDGGVGRSSFIHEDVSAEPGRADQELESLAAFLRDQLHRRRLANPLNALCEYLAELVDEDGYLAQEDLDGLSALKIPQPLIDQALEVLQSLDPPGVGARSLSECLLLQLSRREGADPLAMDIAARFLPELGRKHYAAIAQKLGVDPQAVRAAERVISGLDPHPGRAFQGAEPTVYIRPDVFVAELEGEWKVVLNDYYLPRVSINDYYLRLLKESGEKETRDYLRQKLQQAKWLLDNLERRGSTLRRCAEAALEAQRPFFTGETAALTPMTLSALAEKLALHPSTVSRAVRGKYLQCRRGTYPLRYFFSRPVSGGISRQAAKQTLLALVKAEDPCHPLSDQALCGLLEGRGIYIARRTVAKYRLELGIRSSAARRK
ncbi:MAG: RNA polymerase factor sigma-54 [Oscillibacter sp.]|nr:RNA polymerase factor sigma-54 [Oscillibacter sp.]